MPLPWLIPAGIQAGSSLLGYFTRPKRKPFGETPYGQYLARIASEGTYPPEVRRGLLGEVSRRTGTQAQQARARIRGGLVSRGMGRSIAGERLLAMPGRERMRSLAGTTERIERENLLSKRRAGERLGMEGSHWEEMGRAETTQARMGLLSGLGQAGLMGYQGYRTESARERLLALPEKKHPGMKALVDASEAGIQIPHYGMQSWFEKEKMPFEIPPDFASWTESQVREFSINTKIPFDFLQAWWYNKRAEQEEMQLQGLYPSDSINRGLWPF